MKRKAKHSAGRPAKRGDIRADFTPDQLAAIGAVAMSYNETEAYIDLLFFTVTRLPEELRFEVGSRIHGIDGKIAVIKRGASALGLEPDETDQLSTALGDDWFGRVKSHRDAVIHALLVNAPMAVGVKVGRRAEAQEILLTKTALDALYEHIVAVGKELDDAYALLAALADFKFLRSDDPGIGSLAEGILVYRDRFREHRTLRRSLPKLPEFPPESELQAARDAWFQARKAEQTAILAAVLAL